MAVNVNNAFVGTPPIDGGVYFTADVGTTLPTSATDTLDDAFRDNDHGAVGPDGFTVTPTRTSSTEKMFGGGDFIDLQTEYTEDFSLVLLEDDNDAVIVSSFGEGNYVKTDATDQDGTQRTIYHTEQQLPIKSHVLKAVSGEKAKTYVIPRGRITSIEKTADVHSASTKTTINGKCFKSPDPAHKGAFVIEYRDDGVPAGAVGAQSFGAGVSPAGEPVENNEPTE